MPKDAVDVYTKLPASLFHLDGLEREERLNVLETVLRVVKQHPQIKDSEDLPHAVEMVGHRVDDDDAQCALAACRAIEALAGNLVNNRIARTQYRAAIVPQLLKACGRADRDSRVLSAVNSALDAFFLTTTVSALAEHMITALQLKDPNILIGTLRYLVRCVSRTPFPPVAIFAKMLGNALLPLIQDSQPGEVRDDAVRAMGTLLRVVGVEPLGDALRFLAPADYERVYEASCTAKVKSASKEDIPRHLRLGPRKDASSSSNLWGVSSAQAGSSWSGFDKIRYHFVFGDSYSDVGYKASPLFPQPTFAEPLGVEFPGQTYAGGENWVGSLCRTYKSADAMAFSYARGSDNVPLLSSQVRNDFLRVTAVTPEGALWTANDSLFWTWIGANDVAQPRVDVERCMDTLFELQEELFTAGARNFVFVTVPPLQLAPLARVITKGVGDRVEAFNGALVARAAKFQALHGGETSVLLFDAHALLADMARTPDRYGLGAGGMWADDVHPTAHVHRVLAREMRGFLDGLA